MRKTTIDMERLTAAEADEAASVLQAAVTAIVEMGPDERRRARVTQKIEKSVRGAAAKLRSYSLRLYVRRATQAEARTAQKGNPA